MVRWIFATLLLSTAAYANDAVRLVDTQAQIYVDWCLYVAQDKGYYAAENLDPSIIVGRGGSDSLQAVVTGSQDILSRPGMGRAAARRPEAFRVSDSGRSAGGSELGHHPGEA